MEVSEVGTAHVDLWSWRLLATPERLSIYRSYLSQEELARAARFYLGELATEYMIARGRMREVLSRYSGTAPEHLVFVYNEFGKPSLAGHDAGSVHFNLSHSNGLAVLAICQGHSLGVDIEAIRVLPPDDTDGSYFAAGEREVLQALSEEERNDAFLRCWTRKEAVIKAVGQGLSIPLESFEVEFREGEPAGIRSWAGQPSLAKQWAIHPIEPMQGWVGAIAANSAYIRVRTHVVD